MRDSKCVSHPQSYAMLAHAQLALRESLADIAATLDEYAALVERTELHLFEGELRAPLAKREGRQAE